MTSQQDVDGIHGDSGRAGSWAVAWVMGEFANQSVWERVSAYVGKLRHAETAKVFQGTVNGSPAVYIFHGK